MMKKYVKPMAAALACVLALLFSSCVEKPQVEDNGSDWQGKEEFKVSDKLDTELLARYEEYKENSSLAFTANSTEDESLFETEDYGEGVKIVRYNGEATIIVVPEDIGGKAVLSIGDEVFAGSAVRAVSLPDSIVNIDKGAFKDCNALSTLRIPFVGDGDEITHFGYIFGTDEYENHAVGVPASLDMVIIGGDGVTEIADNAFAGCKSISAVVLPEGVEKIGEFAFYECKDLVYLDLATVSELGEYSLAYCSSLFSLDLRKAESIELGVLYECNSLRILELSFVGKNSFENRYIGHIFGAETADHNCSFVPKSLRSVSVSGCDGIPDRAFAGCKYIGQVLIGEGVESIGVRAFYGCRSIVSITVPDAVKSVGDDAFFGCDNLEVVELGTGVESIGMQAFYGCRALKVVEIPEKVTEIKPSTFALCESLESVTLNNVKKVGKDAFWKCESLVPVDCTGIEVAEGNERLAAGEKDAE